MRARVCVLFSVNLFRKFVDREWTGKRTERVCKVKIQNKNTKLTDASDCVVACECLAACFVISRRV